MKIPTRFQTLVTVVVSSTILIVVLILIMIVERAKGGQPTLLMGIAAGGLFVSAFALMISGRKTLDLLWSRKEH
jgi:hypothetical protein